jgi:hypothetical protein
MMTIQIAGHKAIIDNINAQPAQNERLGEEIVSARESQLEWRSRATNANAIIIIATAKSWLRIFLPVIVNPP